MYLATLSKESQVVVLRGWATNTHTQARMRASTTDTRGSELRFRLAASVQVTGRARRYKPALAHWPTSRGVQVVSPSPPGHLPLARPRRHRAPSTRTEKIGFRVALGRRRNSHSQHIAEARWDHCPALV